MAVSKCRRGRRIGKRTPVHFGPLSPKYIGFMKNISETGLALSSKITFSSETELYISIPDVTPPIETQGRVMWTSDARLLLSASPFSNHLDMGIALVNPPESYRDFVKSVTEAFKEIRREPRFEKVFKISLGEESQAQEAFTQNISRGGLYVVMRDAPAVNTILPVRLWLSEINRMIHAEMQVMFMVREKSAELSGMNPGIGLRFTKIDPDDVATFNAFIDGLAAKGKLD